MHYIKTQLAEGITLTTEITAENVFAKCSNCGKEFQENLVDTIEQMQGIFSFELEFNFCCNDCALEYVRKKN